MPEWSTPHEIVEVKGVVVTLRELTTGRVYRTHHDRLSNPLFLKKEDPTPPREHEPNANPVENPKEPGEDLEPEAIRERHSCARVSGELLDHLMIQISIITTHFQFYLAHATRAPRITIRPRVAHVLSCEVPHFHIKPLPQVKPYLHIEPHIRQFHSTSNSFAHSNLAR